MKDGIVDEESYLSSKIKTLFLLKEVNAEKDDWDLRSFVKEGARWQTWNNITRWVMGIRSVEARDSDLEWSALSKITEEQRREVLASICVVNLKKSPGSYTTDPKALEEAAQKGEVFLKKQLSFYHPDLVVCCGSHVTEQVQRLGLFGDLTWQMTKRGVFTITKQPME